MKHRVRIACAMLAALAIAGVAPAQDPDAIPDSPFVVVCPVEGVIDDGVLVLIKRAIREARDAEALIFVIDTPGGYVQTALEITEAIMEAPVTTIAYPSGGWGAVSAGAIISVSCDHIIMGPGTSIGAAQVVAVGPEGSVPLGEKETSFMREKIKALAEANGHNAFLAMGMVDKDIELKAFPIGDGKYRVEATNLGQAGPKSNADDDEMPEDPTIDRLFAPPDQEPGVPLAPLNDLLPKDEPEAEVEEMPVEPPPGYNVEEDGSFVMLGSGKLLTLGSTQALQFGLADAIVDNVDAVKAHYGYADLATHTISPTWSEDLYRWVTSPMVSGLLLMLGMGGLYMEIRTPGFGMFGIVGIVCLTIFFGSRYIVGLSEWIDLVLLAAGVGLLVVELFFIPGFGIFGISGIGCIVVGLYLSLTYHDFKVPEYSWEFDQLREGMYSLLIASGLLAGLIAATWKLLPYTPLYGRLILANELSSADGYVSPTESGGQSVVGLEGAATSLLRPSGRARFGDKTYRVVTRGDYIEQGAPIVIVEEEGGRYVVERRKEST